MFTSCGGDADESFSGNNGTSVTNNTNANDTSLDPAIGRLEFPKVKGGNSIILIHRTNDDYDSEGINYAVEWDCDKKSQRWTCYQMTKNYKGNAGYYGSFEEDPDIPSSARFSDTYSYYRGSGFTRGHICPSADRQYSKEANKQTFYYTNMQPQYYNFNGGDNYSGEWVKMENQVRTWTNLSANEILYVCKGGTIDKEEQILSRIKGELIVPKYFFMALLCKNAQGYKALAFWVEHTDVIKQKINLADYVISIDELEQKTGIDFFCNLPDDIENSVESLPRENIIRAWGLK